jgi:NAD-dependent deacetylase
MTFEGARALIAEARRVVILTGAGVSAESGVPTFRGSGGLWKSFRAEDLATPQAFHRDPRLVWEWYGWRRELVSKCEPNAAHHAIARFAASRPGVAIVTQNVDGLHRRASTSGAELLELHGSLYRMRCTSCSQEREGNEPVDASSAETLLDATSAAH